MKIIETYQRFRSGYLYLYLMSTFSMIAGLGFIFMPEITPNWLIQFVGITWVLDSLSYISKLVMKHIESGLKFKIKKNAGTKKS